MTFTPTEKDLEGLQRLLAEARQHDGPVEVRCFSKDEAYWIRDGLERQGINVGRITWLEWPHTEERSHDSA